jgi:peptidoglycan L-alanyl-D-glutamate endopeptidase CwlK
MIDRITLQRIELLHPNLRDEVRSLYTNQIVPALSGRAICRFAYTLRTFTEQDQLFAQGRSRLFDAQGRRLGIVTNARGGQSYHNFGTAIDIVLLVDNDGNGTYEAASWETNKDFDGDKVSDWMEIVRIFKANGWTWGGDFKSFKDFPHFEKTFGLRTKQMLDKHNKKDFIQGTNYIKL